MKLLFAPRRDWGLVCLAAGLALAPAAWRETNESHANRPHCSGPGGCPVVRPAGRRAVGSRGHSTGGPGADAARAGPGSRAARRRPKEKRRRPARTAGSAGPAPASCWAGPPARQHERQGIFERDNANSDLVLTHVHPKLTAPREPEAFALRRAVYYASPGRPTARAGLDFEYDHSERLNFQAGRFLVPFGQWNQIHDVFDHKSIAYPLMYLGHEEEELALEGGPRPIVSTAFSDIGLLAFGSFWPRPERPALVRRLRLQWPLWRHRHRVARPLEHRPGQ